MYGKVLPASVSTMAAAIVLPNTGSNHVLAVAATITLVVGVIATVTSIARIIAKKAL